jgi:hypothetical protein
MTKDVDNTSWVDTILIEGEKNRFTGSIVINFAHGGITSVDRIPAKEHITPPR